MSQKVLVAMSGGVDSAVAAFLLKKSGYTLEAATMMLQSTRFSEHSASCCNEQDILDAKAVADRLCIPHRVFDFSSHFEEMVVHPFIADYLAGRTPNPCINCNRHLKFDTLFSAAKALSCEKIATGHYARVVFDESRGRYLLKKAIDPAKDQSYVLYSLSQSELSHILFPLGDMSKTEARTIAEAEGFINAQKRDSQDICFVPDKDYVGFIERATGMEIPTGSFIDKDGSPIGTHKGIIRYTVGQHKKLGLSTKEPLYVVKIDPSTNAITLGTEDMLYGKVLTANRLTLSAVDEIRRPTRLLAKIRYRHTEAPATVTQIDDDRIRVVFDVPQRAITPGQSLVLYDGDTVVGGGIIE